MKIQCKCGNILTNRLQKVHCEDAYDVTVHEEELAGFDNEESFTYEHKDYSVKQGTYHRWENKWSWGEFKNSYVVSDRDLVGTEIFKESKGCCRSDHYALKCNVCDVEVGYGHNDCWQEDSAFLYTIKTKVVK